MARVNAQQWLAKWGTNLNASSQYITNGVKAVTVAPGVSAAAASDRMLAGIQASVSSGKWGRAVSAVSLQSWQNSMINKGIPRLAQGVTQAQATKQNSIAALLTAVDSAANAANQLPKGGLEQGIARATTFMRAMSANAPSKQGGNS